MTDKFIQEINESEVPEYLRKMLEIEKKSELKKYCKKIVITKEDLVKLITNCYKIGYFHQIKYNDFLPPNLEPTDKERQAISSLKTGEILTGDAKKFANKLFQLFKQRRYLVAHIFYNKEKWHLFYFDQKDMEEMKGNHWQEGSHIHFVNYLWPQYNIDELWKIFDDSSATVGGKLHIRYKHQERYISSQ